jgi:hypothetical protein
MDLVPRGINELRMKLTIIPRKEEIYQQEKAHQRTPHIISKRSKRK